MPNETANIDLIIQYSLLAAGDEDEYIDRRLGPIHLIKYVYLADLAYAKQNNGQTYTGIKWRFYKFGPWSQEVNARIDPALNAIHASKKEFPSNYEDKEDWVRWELCDDELLQRKQRELPATITLSLKSLIHKFNKDTPSLLNYVYKTAPMLSAAPNEYLDFRTISESSEPADKNIPTLRLDSLSNKKKKVFQNKLNELRGVLQKKREDKPKLINPVPNPRYDEVYKSGIFWLETLAGEKFTAQDMEAEFSPDIWNSPARSGEDVS